MSGRGDDDRPLDPELVEQMRRHNIAFERPQAAVQTIPRQNQGKTRDKNGGRKPSSNHPTKEDQMNAGTNVVGRDVAGSNEAPRHHPLEGMSEADKHLILSVQNHQARTEAALREVVNPLSFTNIAKYAANAGITVGLAWAVYGVVSLFKGPEVVATTIKPLPLK